MKNLVILLSLIFAVSMTTTSCGTSKGCGYAKAMKFNQKQSKKHNRHVAHQRSERMFINF